MKRLRHAFALLALMVLAAPAWAQNTVTLTPFAPASDTTPDVYRGTSILQRDAAGMEACARAIEKDASTREPGEYSYGCQPGRTSIKAIVKKPGPLPCPPQPAQESRSQACTVAGTIGSWTQTLNYVAAASSTCWKPGAWLPATAPAGACTTPPPVSELPVVNEASFTTPAVGGSARRIPNPGLSQPYARPYRDPDGMGAFRTVCGVSHMGRYDPIVFPGMEVAGHPHTFFGNTGARGTSTPESILASGNGTCRGGIVNRSAYWVPTMVDTRDGRAIRPREDNDIYYKTGYSLFGQNDQIKPFPPRFRMIAGDSKSRVAGQRGQSFTCNGAQSATIPNCQGGQLVHVIAFPQCWDGANLDSPDHRSHVLYANNGACPSTHPVKLPEVSYHIKYDVPAGGTGMWRLSSDLSGTPAGSSSHGDWMNGWEQEVMDTWVRLVINQGLSGGSHIVGDGRILD